MTGWMSGGGGMMAAVAGVETGASTFTLFLGEYFNLLIFKTAKQQKQKVFMI